MKQGKCSVVAYGDAVLDIILYPRRGLIGESVFVDEAYVSPGGAASNTAVGLSRLGVDACILVSIGGDVVGRMIIEDFEKERVDTSYVRVLSDQQTGLVVSIVLENGRKYLLSFRGASKMNTIEPELMESVLASAKLLYVSGYVFDNIDGGESVVKLVKVAYHYNIPVYLELGGFPFEERKDIIPHLRGFVNFLSLSLDDLGSLTPFSNVEESLNYIHSLIKPGYIFLKLGKQGSLVFNGVEHRYVKPCSVELVDPTGCGDAFNAGVIYALLNNYKPLEAAHVGNAMGGFKAMGKGARYLPRSIDELKSFMQDKCSYNSLE